MKFKLTIIVVALIATSAAKTTSAQNVVIDPAHIVETLANAQRLERQIVTMIQRAEILFQTLDEARGITDIGEAALFLLNQNRTNLFLLDPPSALFDVPEFDINTIFPKDTPAKETYSRRGEFIYSNIARINGMYLALQDRRSSLDGLRASISLAETNKQILDLTARIAVENALQQNDLAMISVLKMSLELTEKAVGYDEEGRKLNGLIEISDVQ